MQNRSASVLVAVALAIFIAYALLRPAEVAASPGDTFMAPLDSSHFVTVRNNVVKVWECNGSRVHIQAVAPNEDKP